MIARIGKKTIQGWKLRIPAGFAAETLSKLSAGGLRECLTLNDCGRFDRYGGKS
jgi:hypothetical protein